MTDQEWTTGHARALAIFYNGEGIPDPDRHGRRLRDASFLLLVNPTTGVVTFTLPDQRYGTSWALLLDTTQPRTDRETAARTDRPAELRALQRLDLHPHSLRLLIRE